MNQVLKSLLTDFLATKSFSCNFNNANKYVKQQQSG